MKQKKELNVLYIITKLELGGAQKVCLSLKNDLQKMGHNTLLISGKEGPLVKEIQKSCHVYLLESLKHSVSISGIWNELKNFFYLIKKIRKLKKRFPNLIIHTHSTKAGIIGRWAAFFARVKKRVHTIHGYAFHKNQNKIIWSGIYFIELITSLITTHFICVSSKDVETGIKLFPKFASKHSIIRAAVDWEQFYKPARKANPFPQNEQPFIFGTTSCFKKQKNIFDLLNAFKIVHNKKPNSVLEIVGDGILRPEIENWILKNNIKKNVVLHGWKEKVEPIAIKWHAFVLSSLWEGLPCAIVEARLLKIPVLSYNTGGIHDVILHGENGFLYNQKDVTALSSGMIKIMEDRKLFCKLQNFQENLDDFNNLQMAKQHIELYNNLL